MHRHLLAYYKKMTPNPGKRSVGMYDRRQLFSHNCSPTNSCRPSCVHIISNFFHILISGQNHKWDTDPSTLWHHWIMHMFLVFNQGSGEEEMAVSQTGSKETRVRRGRKQQGRCVCVTERYRKKVHRHDGRLFHCCPSGCYFNMDLIKKIIIIIKRQQQQ